MSHQEPISLRRFAESTGLPHRLLSRYCREGKIIGARKHHLTKQWWIYPPAKFAMGWRKMPTVKGGAA